MSMVGHLDERDERAARNIVQNARDTYAREWMRQNQDPEVRLAAFDSWLILELAKRLDWAWAGAAKDKRIHQCRMQIDALVRELWRRGWMLDGRRLADRITDMLDAVGKAQRAGQVRDFWPYYKATVSRYVGLNAEEIQEEAMSAGAAVADVFKQLVKRTGPATPTLPELVAQRADETLRAKVNRQKRLAAQKPANTGQIPLL